MLSERLKKKSENNLSYEDILQEEFELKKEYKEMQKVSNDYGISINESHKNDADVLFYEFEREKYRYYATTCIIFGVLLILYGFRNWYVRHQIYIDAEIKWKGQTFRDSLKNADNINNSKYKKTDLNDETPLDESIS